jgi:DNA-binding IclR family transcriptional regulator
MIPLHAGAPGKLLLAYLPEEVRDKILADTGLVALTARTITSRAELEAELAAIRERGWATSFGEHIEGVSCLSVPLRDADGQVVAALSILGPYLRLGEELLMSYLEVLQKEATEISRHLGILGSRGQSS